jgi:hypothetical protein
MLYGSAALGKARPDSDLDVMLFLAEPKFKKNRKKLAQLAAVVQEKFLIDLSFNNSWEVFNSEQLWGNDFLLYCLWQGQSIYDPENIFLERKEYFSKYSNEVLKDKIISAGSEIMRWLVRLGKYTDANDKLGAVSVLSKIIKLNIILLHLRHNLYFDSHKLITSLNSYQEMSNYKALVYETVEKIAEPICLDLVVKLTKQVQTDLVASGLLPDRFYASWEKWENPLKYPLFVSWL